MDQESEARDLVKLLARLGHDLRSPLHAILGYCDLLGTELKNAGLDSQIEDVHGIQVSAAQATDLIDALVDLAKLTQGTSPLAPAPVALGPLVREALEPLRPPGDLDGPPVEIRGGDGVSAVVDGPRLRRALIVATRVILDRAGNRRVAASVTRRPECIAIIAQAEDPRTGAPVHIVSESDGGLRIARSLCARMGVAVSVEADGRILFSIPPA